MCNSDNRVFSKAPRKAYSKPVSKSDQEKIVEDLLEDRFKIGDPVVIGGDEYKITAMGMKYLNSNGDPDRLYASLYRGKDHTLFIMTHGAIMRDGRKPMVDRIVTPAQIINAGACIEGLGALAVLACGGNREAFKGLTKEQAVYKLTVQLVACNMASLGYKVSDLYAGYTTNYGQEPDTSWLLFLAKMLHLVPEQSSGPGRAALKNLLGIPSNEE